METVAYQVENRIAYLTMNRPEKRNALNASMVEALQAAFARAAADDQAKVIVLKANGKAFSAGADLADLQKMQHNSEAENLADSKKLQGLYYQLYTHPKLIIGQVEGPAIAGGCGLATICDLCYCTPEVQMGYPEVKIGFIPALVSVFLSRKIGESRARQLLLTGQLWPATAALEAGLIHGIFPAAAIQEAVQTQAEKLSESTSGASIRLTKALLAQTADRPVQEALSLAARYNAEARATADCRKGIAAFLAKEKLKW